MTPTEVRLALLKGDYDPIPLRGKRPDMMEKWAWQKIGHASAEQVDLWAKSFPDATNTGVLTLRTHDEFNTLYQDDPRLRDVAARGEALRTTTNVLLVASGVLLAGTVVLATQTRFGSNAPTADISFAPIPGGAIAGFGTRF